MKLYLIRHGKTKGNLEKRYIGTTDESLCAEGIQELLENKAKGFYARERMTKESLIAKEEATLYGDSKENRNRYPEIPLVEAVYVSPLKRCIETAKLLYPNANPIIVKDFRECNFGDFENKNYSELSDDRKYQQFIESNGTLPFPNGESKEDFVKRCKQAAEYIFQRETKDCVAFVVHGGTIMSILSEYTNPKQNYFSYQVGNGEGYFCEYKNHSIQILQKLV